MLEPDMSVSESSGGLSPDLRSVFQESDDPVLTAVEVADKLDVSQQAAHSRLARANDRGEIKRKKTGARSVVWWVPNQDSDSE